MIGYVSETSLAWAAGFFDGEGTVGTRFYMRGSVKHRAIELGIGQIDREVLDRFAEVAGVGSVGGPYRDGNHKSPMHSFNVRNIRDIKHVFRLLNPYLGSVKRAQFKRAIEAYESLELTRKSTAARSREIRQFMEEHPGATRGEIAAHFGISGSRVWQVRNRA